MDRIVFDPALQPIPDDELLGMLSVRIGAPLDLVALRQSIVTLYDTGRYADVAVDAELTGSGDVQLRFITRNTWFVGAVSVEGVEESPSASQLVHSTQLELGAEYTEDAARAAIESIQEVLRSNGFFEAHVERLLDYEPAFSQVNIVLLVDPGPRATIAPPQITGVTGKQADKVVSATNWERFWVLPGWKTVTERRIQRGLERIREYYRNRDFLLSSVTLDDLAYNSGTETATPVLDVEPGPVVSIGTTGHNVSRGQLRKLVPVYQEQSVDRDLLVEGARNLTEHFQAKGYFDAQVGFQTETPEPERQTIDYEIHLGDRYKLESIDIRGNQYFDDQTLRERMAITPSSWLRYRHGRFSQTLLDRDLGSITSLYRSNGFLDVDVTAQQETIGDSHDVAVVVNVAEGTQWRVGEMKLEGVSGGNRPYVVPLISSIPGQPFSSTAVGRDRDNVLAFYYDDGYLNARFDWEVKQDPATKTVALDITVAEGAQRFVRASLVGGLHQTSPELVYSRILLKPGDPLSQSLMVETQRNLYDLGIFARVEQAIQNPDGVERSKYLLHQFEEARRYSINFGFGAQIARIGGGNYTDFENPSGSTGFSPRVSFGVTRVNMFGVAHTASLQARISDTRQRALLSYLAPQVKSREDLNLTFTGLYDFSRDINTFASARLEGSAQLAQRLSRANSIRYRLAYRTVDTRNVRISPDLIPVFAQPVRVSLASLDFIQDRRDDPLNSTRGYYNAIETSIASRYIGSQTNYLRIIGRNSSYYRLGHDLVLARSITVGWLANLSQDEADNPIPLPERIFSGGASSHRGFPDNQAGPRDLETGFPLGGRGLFMHNLELRFPLVGDNVGGVLFHDAGNVYSTMSALSFRVRQRDKQDFDYMVHSFGFGIRYSTPIGPIRLDLAFSPNSPRFFGYDGTLEELIQGQDRRIDQRISRFQFFFSIGQTF